MLSHGSGQACYTPSQQPVLVKCEECKAYVRARQVRDGATPGRYRYNAIHGIGKAGEIQTRIRRRGKRRQANQKDAATLAELTGGKV